MEAVTSKFGTNLNQENFIPKQQILNNLRAFNNKYKKDELNVMYAYFQKMLEHEENRENLSALPKLLNLLDDMKRHVDLRIACFDLISKGATDFLNIFPMFFELQAAFLDNNLCCQPDLMQATFFGDSNYELLRGSQEYGVVVFYPQLHQVNNDLINSILDEYVVASQLSIYQDFLIQKPQHLYLEGSTRSSVKAWNEYDFAVNPVMSSVYHSIAQSIANNQPLTNHQKLIFLRDGGAGFYANMCKLTNTLVTKYPIEDDDYKMRTFLFDGKFSVEQLSENERYLIYDSREEKIEKVVAETAIERQGKPAYVVMGYAHTFDKVFLKEKSPAVYRKKFDLPSLASLNPQKF